MNNHTTREGRIMLIIVDMLRGFMEEGFPLYCGDEAREIIPKVADLREKARTSKEYVIHVTDCHTVHDREFQMFPPHCIDGSPGAQIIPELDHVRPRVWKNTFDPFYKTTFAHLVYYRNPNHSPVTVAGVCTDICVQYAVMGLRIRGYPVTVYSDCVASFNQENHYAALKHMEEVLGATVLKLNSKPDNIKGDNK